MKIVIDTSVVIDNLRGGHVWDIIRESTEEKQIEFILPTIVIFEIFSGKSTIKQSVKDKIDRLLNKFSTYELTESVAQRAGELARDTGNHIDGEDYIIAATAIELGAKVLTLNTKHFTQIPQVSTYPIEE